MNGYCCHSLKHRARNGWAPTWAMCRSKSRRTVAKTYANNYSAVPARMNGPHSFRVLSAMTDLFRSWCEQEKKIESLSLFSLFWDTFLKSDKRINASRTGKCHWSTIMWEESAPRLHSLLLSPISPFNRVFTWVRLIRAAVLGLEIRGRFADPTAQDKSPIGGGGVGKKKEGEEGIILTGIYRGLLSAARC